MGNAPLHVDVGHCHSSVEVVKYLLNLAGTEPVELEAKTMVSKI